LFFSPSSRDPLAPSSPPRPLLRASAPPCRSALIGDAVASFHTFAAGRNPRLEYPLPVTNTSGGGGRGMVGGGERGGGRSKFRDTFAIPSRRFHAFRFVSRDAIIIPLGAIILLSFFLFPLLPFFLPFFSLPFNRSRLPEKRSFVSLSESPRCSLFVLWLYIGRVFIPFMSRYVYVRGKEASFSRGSIFF